MKNKINSNLKNKVLKKYGLKKNSEKLEKNFDLFITSSGFENRTIGLINSFSKKISIKKTIIFLYKPTENNLYLKNLENLGRFKKILNGKNIKNNSVFSIDPTNPWEFKKTISSILKNEKINSKSNVLVDITSFTRVFLYEVIGSLFSINCNFLIAYTEPLNYVETLPTGINKIIISPSFSGKPRPNKKSVLLLFLGWETGRTLGLYESYNADENISVIGECPIDKKHINWVKTSVKRNKKIIQEITNNEVTSTLELEEIINFISKTHQRKIKEYETKNQKFYFVISGLGPKIQNLASCFYSLMHKDVQLVYGAPSYWGSSDILPIEKHIESHGIGDTYLYGEFNKEKIQNLIVLQ